MSGLVHLSRKGQSAPPNIAGLRMQTSLYSLPLTIVYGQARIAGNLMHFPEPPSIQSGSKIARRTKGTQATARYFAPVVIALSEGQIAGLRQVWTDKGPGEDFTSVFVAAGWLLKDGATAQSPWTFLTTNHPDQALNYPHVAYVVHPSLELPNGSLQNYTWEIAGLLQIGSGNVDANAKDIIIDILTNVDRGLMWPSSRIGDLTQYGNWITAAGLFLSPAYTDQKAAKDAISELLQATVSAAVFSDGVLKFVPYADTPVTGNGVTYTPNTTPLYDLTDDDFLAGDDEDPVRCTRKPSSEAFNQLTLEFEDRSQSYSPNTVEAKIEADILQYGLRPAPKISIHAIKDITTARYVAQLLLQRINGIRNTYEFEIGLRYQALEPMDLVTLTDPGLGLNKTPVRITEFVELEDDKGFAVTAEDWPFGTATATRYATQGANGYSSNQDTDPGNTATPIIFDAQTPTNGDSLELWIAASGGPTWGGCDVYVSTDNATFYNAGRILGKATYGALTSSLAAAAALPAIDTTDTLAVDLTASGGALASGAVGDVASLLTLCYVDGEFLSYQTATLTSALHYALTTLGRGAYSSNPGAHAIGAPFVRCDEQIFKYAFSEGVNGQVVYFKFPAFNIYGRALQDVSTVPSVAHTITGAKPDALVAFTFQDSVDGLSRTFSWHRDQNTDLVLVFKRELASPLNVDPFDFSASVPDAVLPTGVDSYTIVKPLDGTQDFLQFEPRSLGLLAGPVKRAVVEPAPSALAVKIRRTVTNDTADLEIEVVANASDWPVELDVYEDDPDAAPLLTTTLIANRTLTKADFAVLGGRPLPQRALLHWWAMLENVAGRRSWDTAAADREALPVGAVTPLDYRAAPELVVSIDDDTDHVRITVPTGKTKTFVTPNGTNTVAYTIGDLLDDATVESACRTDETRPGYKVELQGGGTWLTIWTGALHGTPSNPPTATMRAVKAADGSTEDLYITPKTTVSELLAVFYRDGDSVSSPVYQLCVGAADPTPRYVASGVEIGPTDYFVPVLGGGIVHVLSAIVVRDLQVKRVTIGVHGKDSGVEAWLPWDMVMANVAAAQGTVSIDSNGVWSFTADGPANALSFKYATSTSAFPSDATAAAGTVIGSGARTATVTNGGTLTFGQTLFVTIIPYTGLSGAGTALSSIRLRGAFQTFSGSTTTSYSPAMWGVNTPKNGTSLGGGGSIGNYVADYNLNGAGLDNADLTYPGTGPMASTILLAHPVLPNGVTITQVQMEAYNNDTSTPTVAQSAMFFQRVDATTVTSLDGGGRSTTAGIGWQLLTLSLTESTTGRTYSMVFSFTGGNNTTAGKLKLGQTYITYTVPDPSKRV